MTTAEGQKITITGHITDVRGATVHWPAGAASPLQEVKVTARFDHNGKEVTLEFVWPRDRGLPQRGTALTMTIGGDWGASPLIS